MELYSGFEQGPIRPPSEANSMLFRVTRNCSWNRCTFCSVYKDDKFSLRPVDDVIRDIDAVCHAIEKLKNNEHSSTFSLKHLTQNLGYVDRQAHAAASHWYASGCESVFLQDGNSLIIKPENLIRILKHIKQRFPTVKRVTSYARSDAITRISDEDLEEIAAAGLNRIHIGLETASDKILKMVNKGVSKETQIEAGVKVKRAGIELSEYVLTGIGGSEFSEEHAIETADALSQINPDFIRFRTLHILESLVLFQSDDGFLYQRPTDLTIAKEIQLLLRKIENVTSTVKSDHMLNLFQEVDGELPQDKDALLHTLQSFIDMDPQHQMLFQVGKRLGYFYGLQDMETSNRLAAVGDMCRENGLTPGNVDEKIHEMIQERMKTGMNM
jgi:biotin synthase-like enzyme